LSIEFDSASSLGEGATSNTLSFNHTIGSGSDRILVVGLGAEESSSANLVISSVTYNGVAMNLVAGSSSTTASTMKMKTDLYYLLETDLPAAGTYSVVATYSGTINNRNGGAISLFNVAQQAPESVNTNANVGSNTISTDITVITAGAIVVDVVGSGSAGTFTATGSGMTERFETEANTSGAACSGWNDIGELGVYRCPTDGPLGGSFCAGAVTGISRLATLRFFDRSSFRMTHRRCHSECSEAE
jgi:hypothetical protein